MDTSAIDAKISTIARGSFIRPARRHARAAARAEPFRRTLSERRAATERGKTAYSHSVGMANSTEVALPITRSDRRSRAELI